MTRDDILRMAGEAGFSEPNPHDGFMGLAFDYRDGADTGASLERFFNAAYAAGAAAERKQYEVIAKKAAEEAVDLAIRLEREACAKICEELDCDDFYCQGFANAIRARGDA